MSISISSPKSVFISYRRSITRDLARFIQAHLEQHEYDVFLDVDNLSVGEFSGQLLYQIEHRRYFVILCAEGTFDRCRDPQDFVRREIEHAIYKQRKIVPILVEGFSWETNVQYLPPSLSQLPSLQFVRYLHDFALPSLEKLRNQYLTEKPERISIASAPAAAGSGSSANRIRVEAPTRRTNPVGIATAPGTALPVETAPAVAATKSGWLDQLNSAVPGGWNTVWLYAGAWALAGALLLMAIAWLVGTPLPYAWYSIIWRQEVLAQDIFFTAVAGLLVGGVTITLVRKAVGTPLSRRGQITLVTGFMLTFLVRWFAQTFILDGSSFTQTILANLVEIIGYTASFYIALYDLRDRVDYRPTTYAMFWTIHVVSALILYFLLNQWVKSMLWQGDVTYLNPITGVREVAPGFEFTTEYFWTTVFTNALGNGLGGFITSYLVLTWLKRRPRFR